MLDGLSTTCHMLVIKRFGLCNTLIYFHLFAIKINQKLTSNVFQLENGKFNAVICIILSVINILASLLHCAYLNINKTLS